MDIDPDTLPATPHLAERPDPRGRCLPVDKLWLDGRLTPARGAVLSVDVDGEHWRIQAQLPERDPYAQTFGVSLQLADGRVLHGRAALVAAGSGTVVFASAEAPEGGWI